MKRVKFPLIGAASLVVVTILAVMFVGRSAFDPSSVIELQPADEYRISTTVGEIPESIARVVSLKTEPSIPLGDALLAGANTDQAVFDDLVVQEHEVIEGGIVVYNGDARVESGGRIEGDLVVYSGDIRIDDGGVIDGNVSAFSGDVRVAGTIGGNLTTLSGDVNLKDSAVVAGDISVLNGDVKRSSGAEVGGNVVRGPRIELPDVPAAPFNFREPAIIGANNVANVRPSILYTLGSLILRLIGITLLSLIVGLVAWLITQVRPSAIATTSASMTEQPAHSFVLGILVNVVGLLLGGIFAILVCLIPLSLIVYLILFALNIMGWTAIASVVSRRISDRYELSVHNDYALGVTAALMTGVFGLLWAMGGCFRWFGFAGLLVVSSIGAGAVLLPWLNRQLGSPKASLPENSSASGSDLEPPVSEIAVSSRGSDAVGPVEEEATDEDESSEDGDHYHYETLEPVDDFTQLRGIGPVAADRLVASGVTTYVDLSKMTVEEIGEILHWSPDRVRQSDLVGQADRLAGDAS